MGEAVFILAINLAVAGVLTAGFVVLAAYNKAYVSARWIALAYGFGIVYCLFEFAISLYPQSRTVATLGYASFLVAMSAYGIGISRKYGVRPPWLYIGIVCVAATALSFFYVQDLPRSTLWRNVLWQGPYALLQAVALVAVVRGKRTDWLDRLLGAFILISLAHFVAKPFLAAWIGAGASSGNYLQTTYAMISQSVGSVIALSVALATVAVYVRTMLVDAATRSMTDALSGLLNRRGVEERADAVLALTGRLHLPVSLVICDIDHFKAINDSFGHESGDRTIVAFADTLREMSGETHIVGRIGGEEFAAVMSGADIQTARLFAEGGRLAFSTRAIDGLPPEHRVTASFGVAEWAPGESFGDLLRRADMALYEAKNDGRNCVRLAPPALQLLGKRPAGTDRRQRRAS